jgi:hypothetical protein
MDRSGVSTFGVPNRAQRFRFLCRRVFLLFLLLAVPALATQARNSWYLPQSSPGHFLTAANKTKVPPPVAFDASLLQPVPTVFGPKPQVQKIRPVEVQSASRSIDLETPLQYRPPPVLSL